VSERRRLLWWSSREKKANGGGIGGMARKRNIQGEKDGTDESDE